MICTSTTSFLKKRWVLPDPRTEEVERLAQQLRIPTIVAQLLVNRGVTDPAKAAAFLEPRFRDIHAPQLIPNMDAAAERIAAAVRAGEKITLFGDYDVDGITGTAMLWHTLKAAGAKGEYYIPHRGEEGDGLRKEAVEGVIGGGAQLLVTVGCGGSAGGRIARAGELGVEVMVTDHHEFGSAMPDVVIVHPRLGVGETGAGAGAAYPNPDLCGAGVAFKVCWGIAQELCNAEKVN